MFKKWGIVVLTLVVASLILFTSVLKASSINYAFYPQKTPEVILPGATPEPEVAYYFVYPGGILPDNALWYFKAARDKVWMTLTLDTGKKAELALLFSDKRLVTSKILFDRGKSELAFSTLTKGEKYLQMASDFDQINQKKGKDTASFEMNLARAALKHQEVIEEEILPIAPEDAKPGIITTEKYAKGTREAMQVRLEAKGIILPPSETLDN